ncbi:MAG: sulfotransferase family 2 domain-containing protein [Actinomycetales bacterium]|nr:sulfotransferase family 2 domain-containing protein [Actinomycetales bacterium]
MTIHRRPPLDELGKASRAYVKAMGWKSVNLHTHISLVHRFVYVEVPKAGCGTMKATLGGLEAARLSAAAVARVRENPHDRSRATPFVKPYQLPPDLLEEALRGRKWRRFAVVREPASRLLSGYLEKIRQGLQQSESIMARLAEQGRAPAHAADIPFADFIDVVAAMPSREQDPHWRRQADHLGIGIIDYDAVIHLEQLDDSWPRIASLIGVASLQEEFYCRNSTGARGKVADWYTPALVDQVTGAYAADYRAFGYQPPSL